MKFTIFCTLIIACTAINIFHGNLPEYILFTQEGNVLKTENHFSLKIKININNIYERNKMIDEHLEKIKEICAKIESDNCQPIQSYVEIKNQQISNKNIKRQVDIKVFDFNFGSSDIDQGAINALKNDIQTNRIIINNATNLINMTYDNQKQKMNEISKELELISENVNEIHNNTISNSLNIRLAHIIQTVVLNIFRNSEIQDIVNNMKKNPNPIDLLKITKKSDLYNIYQNLNRTIQKHETIANSTNLNIFTILSLSKIQTELESNTLEVRINTPIIASSWSLFKTHPLIFQKGKEYVQLTSLSKFIITHTNGESKLFSIEKLNKCFSPIKNIFLCSFQDCTSKKLSCEISVFKNHTLNDQCRIARTNEMTKIIRIDDRKLYANNFKTINMKWGCGNYEKLESIDQNVWIESDPGCQVTINNETFESAMDFGQMEPSLIANLLEYQAKDNIRIRIRNNTFLEEMFADKDAKFNDQIQKVAKKSEEPIKSLDLNEGSNIYTYMKMILAMFILILLIVLLCCIKKCIPKC